MITPMDAGDQTGFVKTKKVGLGLGYFSIALGLVEVAAPGRLARWLGVDNDGARKTILAYGFRELLAGGALLRGPAVSTNVWNRVIGDVIDAGSLGLAATKSNRKTAIAAAAAFVGTAFVVDLLTARALDKKTGRTFPRTSRPGDRESAANLGFTPQPHDFAAA
jgi:hypothetical protein